MREMEAELLQKSKATPAVQIVASMIRAAAAKRASDIHIEPQSTETSIRLRIDGILREHQRVPRALQNPIVSRVKILSDMLSARGGRRRRIHRHFARGGSQNRARS
jgi:type IV pilus assembly protein PilB